MAELPKFSAKGWRSRSRAMLNRGFHGNTIKFTDRMKTLYLERLAETGLIMASATAVGVCYATVVDARESDPEFKAMEKEAKAYWHDVVCNAMKEQGVDGVLEPIFGGKYKDTIVGHSRKFTPGILALEAKRIEPEYREKFQAEVKHTGGVLLVPASEADADAWREKNAPVKESNLVDQILEATQKNEKD